MKKTILHSRHKQLGAKMADFAGWEMPIQYSGIIQEHNAVRENAGIFDVSHMGRIEVKGPDAEKLLDSLSTNKIAGKKAGSATYTVWCRSDGGCVDDLIVYRLRPEVFFVVVNASNREKDLQHLQSYAQSYDVDVIPHYETDGIVAVQGPKSIDLISEIIPEASEMKPMKVTEAEYGGETILLASTGYTGERGFELYAPNSIIEKFWDQCLEAGKKYGLEPAGLGARDTLRLEAGFALYGHELSEDIFPTETVSSWTVKFEGREFVGKRVLQNAGSHRHQYGAELRQQGIPRQGCGVFLNGQQVGTVTSGSFSPTLKKGIAIVLVDQELDKGDLIEIQVREKKLPAEIMKLPFYQK